MPLEIARNAVKMNISETSKKWMTTVKYITGNKITFEYILLANTVGIYKYKWIQQKYKWVRKVMLGL